jgi:hypothetical protein
MNAAIQRPGADFGASYATIFRIHGTKKYKSIATQCLQAERILPWQRILLSVKFRKQPNCCDVRYNRERCSISGPGDLLKRNRSRQPESQLITVSQSAASIQDRRDPRTAPRQDIRGSRLIVRRDCNDDSWSRKLTSVTN